MLVYQRVNSSLDFCFQKALLVQHFLCGRRYQSPVTQMFASGFLPFSGDAVWIFFPAKHKRQISTRDLLTLDILRRNAMFYVGFLDHLHHLNSVSIPQTLNLWFIYLHLINFYPHHEFIDFVHFHDYLDHAKLPLAAHSIPKILLSNRFN